MPPSLIPYAIAAFGLQIVTAVNVTFLAPHLESLGATPFLVGLILSLDPLAKLTLLPVINAWSDRTTSRFGRRLPFVLVGTPVTAVALLTLGGTTSLSGAGLAMAAVCVGTAIMLGPYRAALSEVAPPERHSTITALQGAFQGLGSMVMVAIGTWIARWGQHLPFHLAAAGLVATVLPAIAPLRHAARLGATPHREPLWPFLKGSLALRWYLISQFCGWLAVQVATAFFVLFIVHDLFGITDVGSPAGQAASRQAILSLAVFALATILSVLPFGRLVGRFGKRPVLTAGYLIMSAGFAMGLFAPSIGWALPGLALAGIGVGALQVVPLTLLTELQPPGHEGAMISLHTASVYLPQLLGVPLAGMLIQASGSYRVIFWIGTAAALLACAALQRMGPLKPPAAYVGLSACGTGPL
jgi:MFS family permease